MTTLAVDRATARVLIDAGSRIRAERDDALTHCLDLEVRIEELELELRRTKDKVARRDEALEKTKQRNEVLRQELAHRKRRGTDARRLQLWLNRARHDRDKYRERARWQTLRAERAEAQLAKARAEIKVWKDRVLAGEVAA